MKKSLIDNGERPTHMEKPLNRKPCFFDAILISKNSSSPPMRRNYQFVPIGSSPYPIHIHENKANFTCNRKSLELVEDGRKLTEDEVFEIFSNFAFVEDKRVSFLLLNDNKKIRQRKTKKQPQLQEEVKI